MCGIVGYVGPRFATPILLDGLQRLEYRGYDSAGIAVLNPAGEIEIEKTEGKLRKLLEALEDGGPAGFLGVGHTRWATHGLPNEVNAHPHPDCRRRIVLVHNGIIENYSSLRQELVARGHDFVSETDTEVLAHLFEEEYDRLAQDGHEAPLLPEAVRRGLKKVRGAYAIAALCRDEPQVLVGARLFSPLIVGLGQGENYLASDIPAIMRHTRRAMVVDDGEVVMLTPEEVTIRALDGQEMQRDPLQITWNLESAEKGGYPHFYLKEVHEQPEAIANTLRGRLDGRRVSLSEWAHLDLSSVNRVNIVACGTSSYAGLVGKLLMERWAQLPVEVSIASEFRYGAPIIDERTLVVLITQSGETADTLAGFRLAQDKGAITVALTNVVGSSITRGADATIYFQAGPEICVVATKTYTTELVLLCLVALDLGRRRGLLTEAQVADVVEELRELPAKVELILQEKEAIEEVAKRHAQRQTFFFIGRNLGYPTAMEGALKLKEISYVHAEGYPAGELKHGPIAVLDDDSVVFAIVPESGTYEKVVSNIQEVRARRADVLAVATAGDDEIGQLAEEVFYIPPTLEVLTPVLAIVPLQLFAYHVAVERGCDVDQPRNLAKSVTVE
ncbi:MAG: glutamine--fructose-6-phosphate transaminase (isomerizing) [Anaerolineae bacterium]|nr:glutamine--fructose-6-phosphate transaminase (isomerizing) [Anaerolineae bacterium]NIN95279.1 glutamine--fructose-6-phosphate transaminase (isomerizing) [Anaerolineae bacterium]NIQ78244.1 glutamine--fructose-6-phosphate transaminase (isomerizing) [Anaerolineae bacterium]